MPTADEIIEILGLEPHPEEGGHFRETYRSEQTISLDALPDRYAPRDAGANRTVCTQIYYLLKPGTFSALHVVNSDETFHHYMGDAVEQLWIDPQERSSRVVWIGNDLVGGQRPQVTVPHGTWQGARLARGCTHGYALLGCTVAPGFEYADFSMDGVHDLARDFPEHAELIAALTPPA